MEKKPVAPLIAEFSRNKLILGHILADFTEEEIRRTTGGGNPALWILGHIAMVRLSLGRRIGLESDTRYWESAFGKGSDAAAPLPNVSKDSLLAEIEAGHGPLMNQISGLSAEQLSGDSGRQYPDGGNDVYGMIAFLAWHEAYHLGQLGLIRSCLGKQRRA
jgi:hypothetical protein